MLKIFLANLDYRFREWLLNYRSICGDELFIEIEKSYLR